MTPSPVAKAFRRKWWIIEMKTWPAEFRDLIEPAHITFLGRGTGEMTFCALHAWLDTRYSLREGKPYAEFSWQGEDDGEPTCGRGWAILEVPERIAGSVFIHLGDESTFVAPSGRLLQQSALM